MGDGASRESIVSLAASVAVGALCSWICLLSPVRAMGADTVAGRLGAASFACHGALDLREVDWIDAADKADKLPYYVLRARDGAIESAFGPMPALLGAPSLESLPPGAIVTDHTLARRTRWSAAIALGLATTLLAAALRARISASWAALLALSVGASFAGIATLGQALWQQTALLVPLVAALATTAWSSWRRGALLAVTPALLALSFFTRPGAAFLIAGMAGLWWLEWRRARPPVGVAIAAVVSTALVAAALGAWSWSTFGHVVPLGQYTTTQASLADGPVFQLSPSRLASALAGLAFSPARGIVLFAPLLPVALALGMRGGDLRARVLGVAIVLHALLVAAFHNWWGGWAFGLGPRLLAEALWLSPWVLVGVRGPLRRAARAVVVASCALTVGVGLLGCFRSFGGWDFRRDPDHHPEALWDVRDSPIASALRGDSIRLVDAPAGPYAYCVEEKSLIRVRPR